MGIKKIFSILTMLMLVFSFLTNVLLFKSLIFIIYANPGDVSESWYNETTLNVTVLYLEPRINWYDFQYNQSGTWVSRLNAQIDVNNSAEYRFIVNISSDQGWADIEYINITAWYDNGSENTSYNDTGNLGGNLNLYLQYENTTGTANFSLLWPDDEVTEGEYSERVVTDVYGSPGHTECHNITFSFIPGYQFRHAPGDGSWDSTSNATNDKKSWNFKIYADDGTYASWVKDEFGVYANTAILSAGWPVIYANPGENATAQSNVTLITRTNGNYSLSVNVDDLQHKTHPTANISNTSIWVRGGDLDTPSNFTGTGPIYFYGGPTSYHAAEDDGTSVVTDDVEYTCDIPFGQTAGDYNATIHYRLLTQT